MKELTELLEYLHALRSYPWGKQDIHTGEFASGALEVVETIEKWAGSKLERLRGRG